MRDVLVVFTDVKSTLTVTVQHAEDRDTAVVVVYPADPAAWHARSRRTQVRSAGAEPVVMDALPDGEYLVVAVADVAGRSLNPADVRLLERLRPLATPVQVVDGAATAVHVRAAPLPR